MLMIIHEYYIIIILVSQLFSILVKHIGYILKNLNIHIANVLKIIVSPAK